MPKNENNSLPRLNDGWLSVPEKRALAWLAPRVPRTLTPNLLTAIGFAGWVMAFAGYLLVPLAPAGLWLVNLGLVVNWLGDSLDGEIARRRGMARPRFGYFLDQSIDVVGQLVFALGLACSGLMRPEIATLGLAAYLMMTIQSLLRAEVTRVFRLAAGGFGLTETRCLLFITNAAFYFLPPQPFRAAGLDLTYADLLGVLWIVSSVALYLATMLAELNRLARDEPPPRPGEAGPDSQQ